MWPLYGKRRWAMATGGFGLGKARPNATEESARPRAAEFQGGASGSRWGIHWAWLIPFGLAALSLWLGCVGFAAHIPSGGPALSLPDLLYRSLQLFVLESGSVSPPVPWQLEVSRFLAPIVPAWAIVTAMLVLLREQMQSLRLRRIAGHTVLCGLSGRGMQLVEDCRSAGEPVVVIEQDEGNDMVQPCQDQGAIVVEGDASEESTLVRAGLFSARHLFAVTEDDGTNVEIALKACQLAGNDNRAGQRLESCFVHIVDLRLCELFRRHRVFRPSSDRPSVRVFNVYENSARQFHHDHPLDLGLRSENDPRAVHLVVLGFGQMGESVTLQAARIGHYANGRRLRITVVDRLAAQRERSLYGRYPKLSDVCDISFLELDADGPEFLDRAPELVDAEGSLGTVAVCFDDDGHSLSCALSLLSRLDGERASVMIRMASESGLASLLADASRSEWASRISAFGMLDKSCTRELLLNEELDVLARSVHDNYVQNRLDEGAGPDSDPALQPWELLDETYRTSNRHQADHIPVKLRAIGCHGVRADEPAAGVTAFSPEEVELLARMEHARYNAERFLEGWGWGPERDLTKRTNPYLTSWDQLPEEVKDYDRQAVLNIPNLLGKIGQKVIHKSGT